MLLKVDALPSRGFLARLISPLRSAGGSPTRSGRVRHDRSSAGIVAGSSRIPGFTLIELMVTVAVVAILITVGVPSFIDMVKNNRISSQASDFTTALMLARSEAVRRGSIVCVKRKGTTAGSWNAGWDIFPEKSGETDCGTVAGVIQTRDALSGEHTLTVGDPFKDYIRYNSLGVAVDANGVPVGSANFKLCRGTTAKDIANSRLITISATGHPTISPTPPTSCP